MVGQSIYSIEAPSKKKLTHTQYFQRRSSNSSSLLPLQLDYFDLALPLQITDWWLMKLLRFFSGYDLMRLGYHALLRPLGIRLRFLPRKSYYFIENDFVYDVEKF